jgi:hypothetical protein
MKKVMFVLLLLSYSNGTIFSCSAAQIKIGAKLGLIGSVLTGLTVSWQVYNDTSSLIEVQDPEFNQFCQKLVVAIGIKEKMQFKFHRGKLSEDTLGFYPSGRTIFNKIIPGSRTVYINKDYYQKNKSKTLGVIRHELEHHCQVNKYRGSYHGGDDKLMETGADAAAAGFFDCIGCLEIVANSSGNSKKSSDLGYFTKAHYECYLALLRENKKYCDGCKKSKAWLSTSNSAKWSDYLSLLNK